ncbi:MAG: hypothetical protein M3Y72_02565 [Acidobacteriota bacterium]|nr:hypothetical protein [Acidobacteriota bacterium]
MSHTAIRKKGIVEGFNVSPKGIHESLLLRNGKEVIQINIPPHLAAKASEATPTGAEVELEVTAEEVKGHPSHPVFRMLGFTGHDGNGEKQLKFSGKIERINYALHGEPNGGILDGGEFLHLKPHGAAAIGLRAGMEVEGKGTLKPSGGECRVIEAEEVNGMTIEKKPKPKKKAAHQ